MRFDRPVQIPPEALESERELLMEEIEEISIQLECASEAYFPAKDETSSFERWRYRANVARARLKLRLQKVQECLTKQEEKEHGVEEEATAASGVVCGQRERRSSRRIRHEASGKGR